MSIPVISSIVRLSRIQRPTWFNRRSWNALFKPIIAFFLALLMTLGHGLLVLAAVVAGQVQSYTPAIRQATISLGAANGVGKYDRGQIELVSQDNPNARFIAANIVVLQVNQNSAVVEVREKEGLQVEIGQGAHVLLDVGSGHARREEERILAQQTQDQQAEVAQQQQRLEQARQQRQWEQAQAERAQRELRLEQARAQEAAQQREFELAQAERQRVEQAQQQQQAQQQEQIAQQQEEQELQEAIAEQQRMQQELEVAINAQLQRQQELQTAIAQAEQAQRDLEIAQAEEARARQELEGQVAELPSQPAVPSTGEVRDLWGQPSQASIAAGGPNADLPQDYLEAYRQARSQPTPEHYYAFAKVLIDYELPDKALMWLDEAETTFPQTKTVNDTYEAIALADMGQPEQGLTLLESSGLTDRQLKDEIRSYILTSMGEWDQVAALSESTPTAVTQNNRMIAQYCKQPPEIDRDTDLPPMPCSVLGQNVSADPSEDGLEAIQALDQELGRQYSRDPYVLSTLGFLALQVEDYDGAYRYYKEMSRLLDRSNSTPPQLLDVKASAINYLNNYNQNYDFLANQSQDLALLRAEYGQAMQASAIRGVGSVVAGVTGTVSPPNMVIGAIRAVDGLFRARTRRRRIRRERNDLLDQMRSTFRQDLGYVAARPSLEPGRLLQFTDPQPSLLSFNLKSLHLR